MGKGFNELKDKTEKTDYTNLLVVDALNLAFRYKHSGKKVFASEYLQTINSLAKSYQAKKVVITADGRGGSFFRKEISPEYKANRVEMRKNQTEQEEKDFQDFIEEFNRTLELLELSFPVLKFDGVEADDIAAYIVRRLSSTFEHTWLISSDKDWDLLVGPTVSRFSYVTRKEVTKENWSDHYDYDPEDHISIKVLMGDKGDNVEGVPGVGIKRAIGLVREFGSAFDIYDMLPIERSHKYIQNLNEFEDKLLTNYELMDLLSYCEDAIGSNNCKIIDEVLGKYYDK